MSNTVFVMVAYSAVGALVAEPLALVDLIGWGLILALAICFDVVWILTKNKPK